MYTYYICYMCYTICDNVFPTNDNLSKTMNFHSGMNEQRATTVLKEPILVLLISDDFVNFITNFV